MKLVVVIAFVAQIFGWKPAHAMRTAIEEQQLATVEDLGEPEIMLGNVFGCDTGCILHGPMICLDKACCQDGNLGQCFPPGGKGFYKTTDKEGFHKTVTHKIKVCEQAGTPCAIPWSSTAYQKGKGIGSAANLIFPLPHSKADKALTYVAALFAEDAETIQVIEKQRAALMQELEHPSKGMGSLLLQVSEASDDGDGSSHVHNRSQVVEGCDWQFLYLSYDFFMFLWHMATVGSAPQPLASNILFKELQKHHKNVADNLLGLKMLFSAWADGRVDVALAPHLQAGQRTWNGRNDDDCEDSGHENADLSENPSGGSNCLQTWDHSGICWAVCLGRSGAWGLYSCEAHWCCRPSLKSLYRLPENYHYHHYQYHSAGFCGWCAQGGRDPEERPILVVK